MSTRITLTLGLCAASLAFAACSDSSRPGGTTPGAKDTGVHGDASGTPLDSGVPTNDASTTPDSGVTGFDAQTPLDANAPMDAAGFPDATTPFDGGVLMGDPFDHAMLAGQYAQSLCAFRTRCEPAFYDFLQSSEAECITESTQNLVNIWVAYKEAIDAGRAAFNRASFDTCRNSFTTADCITGVTEPACLNIFTGNRPAGAPCGLGIECATGTWCELQALGGCGVCAARAAAQQSCETTICEDNADCFNVQNQLVCARVDVAEGQPCGTVATGLCQGRLQCVGAQPTCQRPAGLNMMCDPMGMTGPACNIYQSHACDPMTNMCAMASFVGLGSMCNTVNQCNYLGDCNMTSNMCVAWPGVGQACPDGVCTEGNFCNAQGNCQASSMMGANCQTSDECGTLFCVNGTCGPLDWQSCN